MKDALRKAGFEVEHDAEDMSSLAASIARQVKRHG